MDQAQRGVSDTGRVCQTQGGCVRYREGWVRYRGGGVDQIGKDGAENIVYLQTYHSSLNSDSILAFK